ncbi:MAG: peptidoglycan DD-metalloendopeptidase family protein [Methylotenera sp.]|nr:peptidoglycan DD-metalloendopeptidase family protein [Methylotenera sp.]
MNLPHYKQHLVCITVLTVFLVNSPLVYAIKKTEPSKQSLSDVQQKLESLKKELDHSQEAHKDAADALKESELAISKANKKLFEINHKQQENKELLVKLASDSITTNQALNEQQKLLSSQLYQQYIHGRQSYAQIILQNEHPSGIARDVQYFSYIAKARAELINKMQGNLNKINKLNEETASTLKEVAELKQKQMDERRVLQNQKQAKSKVVKTLSKQITQQRVEIKKLSRDEKRLSQLVERLARYTPNRFGSSREDSGISWKGLFIKANEGTEVKSVATGRVVFADWLRGFGNLIILDHGDGYMSLYGNNQAVLKQVGDNVRAGDTIASVGNSGGNETNGLYYELRRQSRPFDPLSWSNVN